MKVIDLYNFVKDRKTPRSTFDRAVRGYAIEMLESIIDKQYRDVNGDSDLSKVNIAHLLNHCDGNFLPLTEKSTPEQWAKVKSLAHEASYGGNFLVYTDDVMKNLYPPSKRTPRREETCLDKQATALVKAIVLLRWDTRIMETLEQAKNKAN